MDSKDRPLISGLAALSLVLLALALLWVSLAVTTRWAGIGWWVWLLWIVAAPAGLLVAGGAWVLARAAVSRAAGGSGADVRLPSRTAEGKLAA